MKISKFYSFVILTYLVHLAWIIFFSSNTLYKDENFFYFVAQRFENLNFSNFLELTKNYLVPQPPLVYMIGKIAFKFSNPLLFLRISSATIMFLANLLIVKIIYNHNLIKYSILCLSLWILNPYVHLISLHFYTDSFYLFCVCLVIFGTKSSKFSIWFSGLFLSPLIRQFGVIYPVSEFALEIYKSKKITKKIFTISLAFLGLGLILIHWNGTAPSEIISLKIKETRKNFGPLFIPYFFYYLSSITFWLLPLILIHVKKIYQKKSDWIYFGVICISCFIFFPSQNYYHGIDRLGIFHTVLKLFPVFIGNFILILFSGVGFNFIVFLLRKRDALSNFKFYIIAFFLLQIYNPLCWDKYLLELILIIFALMLNEKAPVKTLDT